MWQGKKFQAFEKYLPKVYALFVSFTMLAIQIKVRPVKALFFSLSENGDANFLRGAKNVTCGRPVYRKRLQRDFDEMTERDL